MASFLDTLFGGGAEKEAADRNRALTTQYGTDAQGYLKSGYDTGTGAIGNAIGAYAPLSDLATNYNKAGSLYLGALGANGPQGTADAQAAFTNAPGYQGAITAGLDAINRRRGYGQMYNSGNADEDALTFGQNLQNQQYNSWLQNLAGAGQTGATLTGTTAAGQAGQYDALAQLAAQNAQNQTGVIGNQLSSNVNSSNLQAQGEASGAKNLLGAGLSLASLGMGVPLGGGSGGGFSNSLFGQASSGLKNMNLGQSLFGGGSPSGYG